MQILIAEDDPTVRILVRHAVERLGHVCTVAADGREAWDVYQRQGADVIISDWVMPFVDGAELCRRVRAQAVAPYTYFIILTALDDEQHALAGMTAGADDYLAKPFNLSQLRRTMVAAERVVVLHRARERTIERRGAVLRVARQLAAGGSSAEVLDDLLHEAVTITGADGAAIFRADLANGWLVPVRSDFLDAGARLLRQPDVVDRCIAEESTAVAYGAGAKEMPLWARDRQAQACLAVPLRNEGRVLGAVALVSGDENKLFTDEDAEMLELLCSIGAAILGGLERAWAQGILTASSAAEEEMKQELQLASHTIEALSSDPTLPAHLKEAAAVAFTRAEVVGEMVTNMRGLLNERVNGGWSTFLTEATRSDQPELMPPGSPPAPAPVPNGASAPEPGSFPASTLRPGPLGGIEVTVHPVARFAELGQITRAIRALPGVQDVVARQLHKQVAVLRVRYCDPTPLAARLAGLDALGARVVAATETAVQLAVDHP